MSVPNWYELILLGVAAWRVFHLLAHDDILDRPRRYVTRYRLGLAKYLTCPYCFGVPNVLVWWGAWQILPHGTLVAAGFVTLLAVLIAAQQFLSSE